MEDAPAFVVKGDMPAFMMGDGIGDVSAFVIGDACLLYLHNQRHAI
jgi:hypothetical protein